MEDRITAADSRFIRRAFPAALLFLMIAFPAAVFRAEQLPLRHYTSADGLASSAVTSISRDSRGFLWFATRDGLSRFDGSQFVNFRINDQPSGVIIWNMLETRDGHYWISTSEGLYRTKPAPEPEAKPVESDVAAGEPLKIKAEKVADFGPTVIFEDSRQRLWGVLGDLYLIAESGAVNIQKIDMGAEVLGDRQNPAAASIAEGPDGSLWIACQAGVVRRAPDGKIVFYPIEQKTAYSGVSVIRADEAGRIWAAHRGSLFVFLPETPGEAAGFPNFASRRFTIEEQKLESSGTIRLPERPGSMLKLSRAGSATEPLQNAQIGGVFQSSDKKIWVATHEDLYLIEGGRYRRLRDTGNFPEWTEKFAEDAGGDLWVGTSGALRFSRNGLTSYGAADGLLRKNIYGFTEASDGTVYILHGGDWRISRITDVGIETAKLKMPESAKLLWTSNAGIIDANGEWWALADNGLYRFAARNVALKDLGRQEPARVYTTGDGLKSVSLYCAFRDSKGNLWFSTRGTAQMSGLVRYDPQTERFRTFTESDGYPEGAAPVSFAEDKSGNLWFGLYGGGLLRHSNGKFTNFSGAPDLPANSIFGLYVDERNRLWIGSASGGVARVDDPSAPQLTFVRYTRADGLSSNNIRTLVGDAQGNIYAGTVRGVSRISPDTGTIKHLTTTDGLAADFVTTSFRDRTGAIWFGTTDGVSKLIPEAERGNESAPQIWISGLSVAGNHYAVSVFGQKQIGPFEVGAGQNNLQIEFLGVGNNLRYQYRLEGAGHTDWSEPTSVRRVNFANLAPNSYRFLVRAVSETGAVSEEPAVIDFTIHPPFYRTWWFLTLAMAAAAGAIFALDRYRVSKTRQVSAALEALQRSKQERLAELERVRSRIATDLHDDIGASLTQIAVLSEVVRSQTAAAGAQSPQLSQQIQPLESITNISNELVETMADIVWAINPLKDNLRDLVQRMRRFASDVLSAKKIKFEFDAPAVDSETGLGANLRREIFAIYKESINNIVKHSGATLAAVSLEVLGDRLHLKISDNGRGFDREKFLHDSFVPGLGGNGLHNLERRGRELGGRCTIISSPGAGTTVLLDVPLASDESENNFTSQAGGENSNGRSIR